MGEVGFVMVDPSFELSAFRSRGLRTRTIRRRPCRRLRESLERGTAVVRRKRRSAAERPVGREDRGAPEEGDDRAEGEKGPEGDPDLARGGAMAGEEVEAGDEGGEHADHQGDG